MWITFSSSILLMGMKFYAYFLTGSTAILTDGMESIVNVLATGFALYSVHFASLPKDENHPYGHGKVEFLSAGFEGGLIIIAGGYIIFQAIKAIITPPELAQLPTGIMFLAFTAIVNFILAFSLIRNGKKWSSVALVADGKHLGSDALSTALLILGVGIVHLTGLVILDSVMALIFGSLLLWHGIGLMRGAIRGLLDEADPDALALVTAKLKENRKDVWVDVHNLRIQRYGADLHVDCHVTLPYYYTLKETHEQMDMLEQLLKRDYAHRIELFIHTDPCIPAISCTYCRIQDCQVRKHAKTHDIEWTLDNLRKNQKHKI